MSEQPRPPLHVDDTARRTAPVVETYPITVYPDRFDPEMTRCNPNDQVKLKSSDGGRIRVVVQKDGIPSSDLFGDAQVFATGEGKLYTVLSGATNNEYTIVPPEGGAATPGGITNGTINVGSC